MLPETNGKIISEKQMLKKLPPLEKPRNIRLKFKKVGSLQYISHLDLQRTFNRVMVRACVPVWYTMGFNPHIKLVFSTPLSVGSESICEYLDIKIDREMSCRELMERLNRELTDELCITEAYIPAYDFSEIAYASYEIKIFTEGGDESLAEKIETLLSTSPLVMTKRTKSGEKEVDIIPFIKTAETEFSDGVITLKTVLSASSTEFLNPELVIGALKDKLSILSGDPMTEWYTILRTKVFRADMKEFY